MQRPQLLIFFIWVMASVSAVAQYTETINTNRPGTSQGAFSIGKNVVQLETGVDFGTENHDVFENKTNNIQIPFQIRVGLFKEQLEFGIEGSYLNQRINDVVGNQEGFTRSGFPFTAIGAKYLIFDPYKYKLEPGADIMSWKANKKFKWKRLIPAVSFYAAANFLSSNSDFAFSKNPDNRATEVQSSSISPRFILSAHNVWSDKLVFVANVVSNNLATEFPEFRGLFTTTYNFNDYLSFFGEYEGIFGKLNNDHILKTGGAYLLNKNLQFDISVLANFKDTPSVFIAGAGVSYRLDFHKPTDNEYIDTPENHEVKKIVATIKKDIEAGELEENTLSGELQSVSEGDKIVSRFSGVDLEEFVQEEEEEEEFEEEAEFDADVDEEEDTRIRWWQIGKKRRLRKKALADTTSVNSISTTGGRRSDFLDDEFFKQKQEEITPGERTAEELAALELRRQEEANKKGKRSKKKARVNEVYIDRFTGDSIPPPDYSGMSRKERKIAEKKHLELFELQDLGLDDLDIENLAEEVEQEQNGINEEKERKRKKKEAKKATKKATKNSKNNIEEDLENFQDEIQPESASQGNKTTTVVEEFVDVEKGLSEDKELLKVEAELAKEEEKERKRLEKEAKQREKELKKQAKLEAKKAKKDKNNEG